MKRSIKLYKNSDIFLKSQKYFYSTNKIEQKYFYNSDKLVKGLLHGKGYAVLKEDEHVGKFVYHYHEKIIDKEVLQKLDIRVRCPDIKIEEYNRSWWWGPLPKEDLEIDCTIHVYPEIKNKAGEREVVVVLGEDFRECD